MMRSEVTKGYSQGICLESSCRVLVRTALASLCSDHSLSIHVLRSAVEPRRHLFTVKNGTSEVGQWPNEMFIGKKTVRPRACIKINQIHIYHCCWIQSFGFIMRAVPISSTLIYHKNNGLCLYKLPCCSRSIIKVGLSTQKLKQLPAEVQLYSQIIPCA